MADFKRMKGSKVSFTLEVSEDQLKKAHHKVIEEYKKHVTVPGFRKGHAPEKEVVAKVGLHVIAREAFNAAAEKQYVAFLEENKLRPINPPNIESPDKPAKEDQPMTLKGDVEVYPEIKVKDYEKIKVSVEEGKVDKKEIEKTIEDVLVQFQQSTPVDRAAKDGDMVTIDFRGKDKDGKTLDRTDGKEMKLRLGSGQFLPDLEKAFVGMKAGEEKKDIPVAFPKDYPSEDFAGKKIPFDVKVHSVGEVSAKNLTPEMLKLVTGKDTTQEDFEKEIEEMIGKQKKDQGFQKAVGEYQEKLAKLVDVDLPESWVQQEINAMSAQLQQSGQTPDDKMKKEFKKRGEKQLKAFLGLSEIIKLEKVELTKEEMEMADQRAKQRVEQQGNENPNMRAEVEREALHMMIDKHLRAAILKEA